MNRARRAKTRRSESGAAVKRTRGGELGRALGCNCSSGAKTVAGFRAALGRASATRRVARAEASDRGGPQLTLLWAPQASTRFNQEQIARFREESPSSGGREMLYGARGARRGRTSENRAMNEPSSCGSKSRAGRSLPQRRPATDVAVGPAVFGPPKRVG